MKNKNKILLFCLLAFVLLAKAGFIFAAETSLGASAGGDLTKLVGVLYNWMVGITVSLALAVIVFGGILYMFSAFSGKAKTEAIAWIKGAVIGLLLAACSYLILTTINPDLVSPELKPLIPVGILNIGNSPNNPQEPPPTTETFNEIPVGTLTENLLSRHIDCYAFNSYGDPIDAQFTTDENKKINGPTYLDHDRVDCLLELSGAIAQKSKIAKELSDAIINQMNLCACGGTAGGGNSSEDDNSTAGNLDNPSPLIGTNNALANQTGACENNVCSKQYSTDCQYPSGQNSACIGSDANKLGYNCTQPCKDTCKQTGCTTQQKNGKCCPADATESMEHGPLSIIHTDSDGKPLENNYGGNDDFNGLDEFRTQYNNSYDKIKDFIELSPKPKKDKKEITVLQTGNCQVCNYDCSCANNNKDCQKNQSKCQQQEAQCHTDYSNCLQDNSKWYHLRLIDQITYLKGKMDEIKETVKKDEKVLQNATSDLGKCYLADTAVDFISTYEAADTKKINILIQKPYKDPVLDKPADSTKYCAGYQYDNASCYTQCQQICPGTTSDDFSNYKGCQDCTGKKDQDLINCQKDQAKCVKEIYDKRKCQDNEQGYSTFQDCFKGCQQQCTTDCNIYEGSDKTNCQQSCNNDSKCLLDPTKDKDGLTNEDKCLMNFNQLGNCAINVKGNDLDSLKTCATVAAKCQYCTVQNAGYPDCVQDSFALQGNFSSSFIYNSTNGSSKSGNDPQKCPDPYKKISTKVQSSNTTTKSICDTLYPETAKCPASSPCPQCPCDLIDTTVDYPATKTATSPPDNCKGTPGQTNPGATTAKSTPIKEAQVCSADCDTYKYNSDPLTFYCRSDWWSKPEAKRTTPVGDEMTCPSEGEIPVGQTIDNAVAWAESLIKKVENVSKKTQDLLDYINRIAKEKNYCQCDSKCQAGGGGESTCNAFCTLKGVPQNCMCTRDSCSGNPCEKMIGLLKGKTSQTFCQTNEVYNGMEYYYNQVNLADLDFYVFFEQSGRSDILKSLSYSRTQTTVCATPQNNTGQRTTMSCTRVEDEIMPPIIEKVNKIIVDKTTMTSYCYGSSLNKISSSTASHTDNWFCCQARINTSN